ncbi:hypothetical protein [uncultured Adlercreutzia sp.]|uniref:hypothetical protein n=1 Tax=uncultured Adlercreutzia sp. TaxID=875803 RepID=UPI0025FCE6AB|nr:hypothetical protein [uncultured Adlercreutzia sp.]MCI9261719.1 hypothetical protein [Eggerthellaceae bacterium]
MSTRTMESGKKRRVAAGRAALALVLALGLGLPVAAFGTGEGSAMSFGEELSDVPGPTENAKALVTTTGEGADSAGKAGGEAGSTGETDGNAGSGLEDSASGEKGPAHGDDSGTLGEGADGAGSSIPVREGDSGDEGSKDPEQVSDGSSEERPAAELAGVSIEPLSVASPTVEVDTQLYLKEQNGQTTYSTEADGANPQAYTGPITLEFKDGSASVTVEGAADIIIAKGTTLTGANDGPVFDFKSGASTLTIAEGASVSLTGASDYAAIRVTESATLTLLGAGSLRATGGDGFGSPAIGAGWNDDDPFGAVRLAMTGSLRLDGVGEAPALGDVLDTNPAGSVEFLSGSSVLTSGGTWKSPAVNVAEATVAGGSFTLSGQAKPTLYGTYATGPAAPFPVTGVQLTGLPAGLDLTQVAITIGESAVYDPGFFKEGDNGASAGYNVAGFNPLVEGAAPCVYLPKSDSLKAGAKIKIAFGDGSYEGILGGGEQSLSVSLQYVPNEYVERGVKDPTLDLNLRWGPIQLRDELGVQKQYRYYPDREWTDYQGTLTLTGGNRDYEPDDTMPDYVSHARGLLSVLSGDHKVNLKNTFVDIDTDTPAVSVTGGATVELTLYGSNDFRTGGIDSGATAPTIFIGEGSTLTVGGKGKLNVTNYGDPASRFDEGWGCAAIGAGSGISKGGGRYAKGGTFVMRGGTLTVRRDSGDTEWGVAIGAGQGGTFGSIIITGGNLSTSSPFALGGAPRMSERNTPAGKVQQVLISGGTVNLGRSWRGIANVDSCRITGGSVLPAGNGVIVEPVAQAAAAPLSAVAFDAPVSDVAVALADDGGVAALAEEGGADVDAGAAPGADGGTTGADDGNLDGESTSVTPVNAFGEELVPVTFMGLPADTNLADIGFHIVNIDLNGAERGLDDSVAVNEYGVYDVVTTDDGSMTFYLTNGQAYRRLVLAAWNGGTYAGMIAPGADGAMACMMRPTDATLFYEGHTFEDGWLCEDAGIFWATDGSITGSEKGPALTAIRFATPIEGLTINYAADNGAGFGEMVASDDITGELMEPMVSLKASLSGEAAAGRGIEYRAYVQDAGWTPWARDGEATRASGDAPVLAVEARLTGGDADDAGAEEDSSPDISEAVNPDRVDDFGKDADETKKLPETGDAASAMLGWALAAAVAAAAALAACAARSRRAAGLAPSARAAAGRLPQRRR